MKNRVNIGTASIVLIFIILCLSVFSLLSLSDAKSALVFAQRRADSVTNYYVTDELAQRFVHAFIEQRNEGNPADSAAQAAAGVAGLPEGTVLETGSDGSIICQIPMPSGQSYYVELDGDTGEILSSYVYNSEEYAIDDNIPVWTGE